MCQLSKPPVWAAVLGALCIHLFSATFGHVPVANAAWSWGSSGGSGSSPPRRRAPTPPRRPTLQPTTPATPQPTVRPTVQPTMPATPQPTLQPTAQPTQPMTPQPTETTVVATPAPTTSAPTASPTSDPALQSASISSPATPTPTTAAETPAPTSGATPTPTMAPTEAPALSEPLSGPKITGTVRLTFSSGGRRLWASWEEDLERRLAESKTQVAAFAQGGLRKVVGVDTLRVVAVRGASPQWVVDFEIPAAQFDAGEIVILTASVKETMAQLPDSSSATFASFVQGAEAVDNSLAVESCEVVKEAKPVGLTDEMLADQLSGSTGTADGVIAVSTVAAVVLSATAQVLMFS